MRLVATSTFRPGNFAAIESAIVPRLIAGITEGAQIVVEEAQAIVPVDTGALKDSIGKAVVWEGKTVTGTVYAAMPYAAFVEFGTGQRGASSVGAGPFSYSPTWPGMAARPYLRPALDTARPGIIKALQSQGFTAF